MSNNSLASQTRRTCINRYTILDSGVSYFILKNLFNCQCSKSHSLIDFDIVTNNCRLTNDRSCSMVNWEASSDFSTRVDIDSSFIMRTFRYESGDHWNSQFMQFMRKSVIRKGRKAWICPDDLNLASCGWIWR